MSELRWILIGFGIVLLAAIYLWGRRGNRAVASDDALVRSRPEPSVHNTESPLLRAVDEAPPAPVTYDVAPQDESPPADYAAPAAHDSWRGRLEPTFADAPTEELPVRPPTSAATPATAPTLSLSA